MNKTARLFFTLFIFLFIGISGVTAQNIQPSGKAIGTDKKGNAVYQVSANGINIGYKLIGSGEPLVMIMGLAWTMDHWPEEVIESLSKRYQLILMDNRGMGYTTANNVTFTFKLFTDDVVGLLNALKVEKANMLGFSMGSTILQELLIDYPERVNKAIIYGTFTDGSNVIKGLKKNKSDNPIVVRQLEAINNWKAPMEKLPLISNQVMLIVGASDTLVGVESSKALASAIPGAWLVQFKKATHRLIFESPAEFAKIVSAFLDINETVEINK